MERAEIKCRNCGMSLYADDFSLEQGMAHCKQCGGIFALHASKENAIRKPPSIPLPKRIEIADMGSTLQITLHWFNERYFIFLFACLVWLVTTICWNAIAVMNRKWEMLAFGIMHIIGGCVFAYVTAAGFFNRTVIRIGMGVLEISHAPLPWPGNKALFANLVTQVFCIEKKRRTKNGGEIITYEVCAKTRQGTEKLVSGIDKCEQALYIEQEIERFLKIEDLPVAGEVGRVCARNSAEK